MRINNNMSAINAHRVLKFQDEDVGKIMARLSSGMRINTAADDASGLAVSEKLRTQINGLRQAERNTEDGMSLIQTADGYLGQVSEILQRVRVLSLQAANGIYTANDRELMQAEISQLIDEVDRIASQAEFNRFKLFQGDFASQSRIASMYFHIGPNSFQRERVFIGTMTAASFNLKTGGAPISVSAVAMANDSIGIVDGALERLMKQRADLGAYFNRLESVARGLMSAYENTQASESRIRDADIAEEMVEFTTKQILVQSGSAMLSQANLRPQSVLRLLNG